MKQNRLWTLFSSMLRISAFTFGGGFVIVSLMKKKLVDELGWLTEEEMLDMTALAQSAPGPIAVNAAILVGRRVAGWPGMLAAKAVLHRSAKISRGRRRSFFMMHVVLSHQAKDDGAKGAPVHSI